MRKEANTTHSVCPILIAFHLLLALCCILILQFKLRSCFKVKVASKPGLWTATKLFPTSCALSRIFLGVTWLSWAMCEVAPLCCKCYYCIALHMKPRAHGGPAICLWSYGTQQARGANNYTLLLPWCTVFFFLPNLTQPRHILEEGISIEQLPSSNCPVDMSVGHFLDQWLMWKVSGHFGRWHT